MAAGGPWALQESFHDTASRAYLAAVCLKELGDDATAAHLLGVAGECAIKATLENAGVMIDRQSGFRVHLPRLGIAIAQSGQTRHMLPLLTMLAGPPEPFCDYSIDTRYAADNCIDEARYTQWLVDAEHILSHCGFI